MATMTVGAGTPQCMAPEVADGGGHYTTAVDVWSFGMLLLSFLDAMEYGGVIDRVNRLCDAPKTCQRDLEAVLMGLGIPPDEKGLPFEILWFGNAIRKCLILNATERPSFQNIRRI